ncbi:MAG: phosphate/phosphite/phosphonate ABC transporter substrate-binding protein [Marinospirillum sp.]|uniref:phosphate/phosphite/phosphonate ABC transporter substrate-binding protein n=1 Tax=Marinospirillum sp. TaxID=2183934 RepID=UPI0019FD5FC8|nr:phosphate/phosphite/phosphonate ABC transporter substrate-binding protein [Marinospirillum sp.]MBE0508799.1 phosphate/phosphite/phosphonate ABC transporter substrate-binding protein [Marinospirillum sp.]
MMMKKKALLAAGALALSTLFSTTVLAATPPASCPTTLRYADTGVEGLEELRRSFGPFVETMKQALGMKVEFYPVGNRTAVVNALRFKQVDVVMTGPSEYVAMDSQVQGAQPLVSLARPSYASIFIVPENSPYQTLADLKGARISMKSVGSTTGHIIPAYMLVEAGLDVDRDVRILNLGGTLFEALISGDVQAAATGVRDWDGFIKRTGGGYRILAQSPQMPDDLVVAGPHIDPTCVAYIRDAMMKNGDALIQATLKPEGRERYQGARLMAVNDASYDVVRKAYAALGLKAE